jgi:hypothetical protein
MIGVKPVGPLGDVAAASKPFAAQPTEGFSELLKSEQAGPSEAEKRSQAILNFYDIHQRSQITGVPIPEYNAAVTALGLDAEKDPFAAIKLLQGKGYEMGAPSLGAILKYGSVPQASGNQSYLAQVDETKPNVTAMTGPKTAPMTGSKAAPETVPLEAGSTQALLQVQAQLDQPALEVVDQRPVESAVTQELQTLNQQFGGVLGSSVNYFEAVKHLSKQLDITPYLSMTLDQALPLIAAALEANQLGMTTDRWLQGKG